MRRHNTEVPAALRTVLLSLLLMVLGLAVSAALPHPADAACITDDTAIEICLDAPPERIISLYGAFTETLWDLGAGPRLVARTKNDLSVPAMADLPSVGTGLRPNVEYLLALRPHLVVSRASRASSESLQALRARGLTVAAFDPLSLEDLYRTVERLGTLTGHSAEATALTTRLRLGVDRVAAVAAAVPVEQRPRVVYEVRADPLTVAGSGGLVDELIRTAGGVNATENPKKLFLLDVEALLRMDPDAYVVQEGPMNRNPTPPVERPHFQTLRCVRGGRILTVDEQLFSRPGPRVAEAAEALGRFLHPQLWEGMQGR
ncbi:MAG TPA: helical backbone metal receptor [Deferrisomatales bacterium]|nr:helical backbone metal receptor [Deferrisomatales bacterium]